MPLSDKGSRKLPYPLNRTLEPIGDTPDEPIAYTVVAGFPDESTRVNITLNLSLDEYVALATAIDVGRDIAFAEDSELVWHVWARAFSEGTPSMSCEDVADCVESELVTNQTLINQLTNTVNFSGFGNPNRVNPYLTKITDRNPAGSLQEPINPEFECDLDKLWGGIRHGIVDRLDELLGDTLEDIAAIPTVIGRNAAWLDIVPVLGDLLEAVLTSLSSAAPTLLSLYQAHSSEATKDEIACDLFALVCAECRYPTFTEIYDYFKNFALPETPAIGEWVLDTMTQLLTNPVGVLAKVAYFTLMCWCMGILLLQATFNGKSGTSAIIKFAKLGEDFATNNWFELCNTCNENYAIYSWDFRTQGQGESYIDTATGLGTASGLGTFVNGKGWQSSANSSGGAFSMKIAYALDPSWTIRAIAWQTSENPASRAATFRPNVATITGSTAIGFSGACPPYNNVQDGLLSIGNFKEVGIRFNSNEAIYLEKIVIIFDNGAAKAGSVPTNDPTIC